MRSDAAGEVVYEGEEVVTAERLGKVREALGTPSGGDTATLVPWFGPTVVGERQFVELLEVDMSRALLGGLKYEWERPFELEETVAVKLFIDSVFDKGTNRFGIVVAEFKDKAGALIHRQSATFIETMGA